MQKILAIRPKPDRVYAAILSLSIAMAPCHAFADVISDVLLIVRPGAADETVTLTDAQEGGRASGTTSFLVDHGAYCVQANCDFGQSNISLKEQPNGPASDTVAATLRAFTDRFDRLTFTLFSDTETTAGGPDAGEISDITADLFTKSPAGFSVFLASDVPEPSSLALLATGFLGLILYARQRLRTRITAQP